MYDPGRIWQCVQRACEFLSGLYKTMETGEGNRIRKILDQNFKYLIFKINTVTKLVHILRGLL